MHQCEEGSHRVPDLLVSWLGSLVPWTSLVDSCYHISILEDYPTYSSYIFPSSAFGAFIAVSIVNIVLALALGWYVLSCVDENCFTVFLPLFASAAPLGNWALYRVGLNVLSYVGIMSNSFPPPAPL